MDIKKCLIIAPHQDDEVLLAGNLIQLLSASGTDVRVLFSTNGDWKYSPEVRIREAIKSLEILGNIPKEHIILLGYSDNYIDDKHSHYYYAGSGSVKSVSGHGETYGACGISDFAFAQSGEHSKYNKVAFVDDLKNAILSVNADLIVCIDFDEHPDHKMLSLSFEEALGMILSENSHYRPIVLKGFAYCTGYTAINDFFERRLGSTVIPKVGEIEKYHYEMINTSVYEWKNRICIPAPERSRSRNLLKNVKARALAQHKTQYVVLRAPQIINSDEVFWLRRTDSISYSAEVATSSGNGKYLNDFQLLNVNDIDSINPHFCDYLWSPSDEKKEARFTWKVPQTISQVRIYGNAQGDGRILKILISFDNGYVVECGPLPDKGNVLVLNVEKQMNVTWCLLQILECVGSDCGIAECEFFETQEFDKAIEFSEWVSSIPKGSGDDLKKVDFLISNLYLKCISTRQLFGRTISFVKRHGAKGIMKRLLQGK